MEFIALRLTYTVSNPLRGPGKNSIHILQRIVALFLTCRICKRVSFICVSLSFLCVYSYCFHFMRYSIVSAGLQFPALRLEISEDGRSTTLRYSDVTQPPLQPKLEDERAVYEIRPMGMTQIYDQKQVTPEHIVHRSTGSTVVTPTLRGFPHHQGGSEAQSTPSLDSCSPSTSMSELGCRHPS